MENNNFPRVCGGTFFTILNANKKRGLSQEEKAKGNKDDLSNYNMLDDLIGLVMPNHYRPDGPTITNNTSLYKKSALDHSDWLCFDSDVFISEFEYQFHNNYGEMLKRVDSFVSKYFFTSTKVWVSILGKNLLDYITSDKSLSDDSDFFICSPSKPIKLKDIIPNIKVSIQQLILGIWYFIISNKISNLVGETTFEMWHAPSITKGQERKFVNPYVNSSKFDNARIYSLLPTDVLYKLQNDDSLSVIDFNYDFSEYLWKTKEKYSKMKTLLYEDALEPFYNFYVENDIVVYLRNQSNFNSIFDSTDSVLILKNATASMFLSKCSNFIVISGTGGLGKSMLMRHLLLSAIDDYVAEKMVPLFIQLKDFNQSYHSLIEFILKDVKPKLPLDEKSFKEFLSSGKAILLFDGLDEISSDAISLFESQLEALVDEYSSNLYIISSRPYTSFIELSRFNVIHLKPFDKTQALKMISKLRFREDEPQFKERFIKELDSSLFYTHKDFAENPLLLTIMLLTFKEYAEIPVKIHLFYKKEYESLAEKHDASKGGYKRPFRTGLSVEQFSDIASEFCARSYIDQKYEFTDTDFKRYFNSLNAVKKGLNPSLTNSNFLQDLKSNVCLMYTENNKHMFMHRSFQEYFCAEYFSKQLDKHLWKIANLFEKRSNNYGDKTFDMMFDMIRAQIEQYVFLPYLEELFKSIYSLKNDDIFVFEKEKANKEKGCHYFFEEYDNNENAYLAFLLRQYETIYYQSGEVDSCDNNYPKSFIYKKIKELERIGTYFPECIDLPEYEEFNTETYYKVIQEKDGHTETILIEENQWLREGDEDIEIDPCGKSYQFDVFDIIEDPEYYRDIIDELEKEYNDFMEEYVSLRKLYILLKKKSQQVSDDVFDDLF